MILVCTIRFSGLPEKVLWPEHTLDFAFGVKYKMSAICARSKQDIIFDKIEVDSQFWFLPLILLGMSNSVSVSCVVRE